MWRSPNWEEGHYIDIHTKYNCLDCGKDFIVGDKLLENCPPGYPLCPYCGGKYVEAVVGTEEDQLEELADFMGCLGIYVDIDEEKNRRQTNGRKEENSRNGGGRGRE